MSLTILLFSPDSALAQTCREVLAGLVGGDWTLEVSYLGETVTKAHDLRLWDYVPGETVLPREFLIEDLQSDVFLVQRRHLEALYKFVGTRALNVLLKPVTQATLQAFFCGALHCRDEAGQDPRARLGELVAERNEMLQFLIQANLKLQEYDQERTNFLARSVHDFRAPLTALSGYCGLLLGEDLGPLSQDQRDVLGRMRRSADRLSRMAEGMFQLSIGRKVTRKLNLERADLRDCVNQALHEVGPFVENKRISVSVDVAQSPGRLLFEKTQLIQLLVNLLDNACKFTPRSGTIEVNGYPYFWERRIVRAGGIDPSLDRRTAELRVPNCFRVDIRDSGPGIPEIHLERIFEEYTSYSGARDRSGGGLGLAIAKMIAQQHQGRVWAENGPAGAIFSFVLPFRPVEAREPFGAAVAGRFPD